MTQEALDGLGQSLHLRLTVLENSPSSCPSQAAFNMCHNGKLTLENRGAPVTSREWTLYFTNLHQVLTFSSDELGIRHVNGSLHAVTPTAKFTGFAASDARDLWFQASGCVVSATEILPRAYLVAPGLKPVMIANTDGEDPFTWAAPMTTEKQLLCNTGYHETPATAAARFASHEGGADRGATAAASDIVPSPQQLVLGSGKLSLAGGLDFRATGLSEATVAAVTERFLHLGVSMSASGTSFAVVVDAADPAFAGRAGAEAYRLSIDEHGVSIVGADAAGALNGVMSVLDLLPAGPAPPEIPQLAIPYDAPRYPVRGLHVDVARNFHGLPELLRLIAEMAAYKLNTLHLHLSDDEGFRLEIPGLPELTGVGARRCHTVDETDCLMPQLGSGPFSDSSGSGYFSRPDFIALLRAARAFNIRIVPEFDMPGHSRAAIRAMALRALGGDPSYALTEATDASKYSTVEAYDDDVMNGCLESSYAFAGKLMDEVQAMYREADAPLETWHLGGDEVPAGAWSGSPACAALVAAGILRDTDGVAAYVVSRLNAMAQQRGLGVRGWQEAFFAAPAAANGNPLMEFQDPIRDLAGNAVSANYAQPLRWYDGALPRLTELGYKVILTPVDYLYFDQAQEVDPAERGLSWGTRASDTHKVFTYLSGNIAANIQLSADCSNDACQGLAQALPVTRPENVIGVEAALWGETIRTDEQLEYMAFPRLLALAERAWHRASWEPMDGMDVAAVIDMAGLTSDWERFANTLGYKELPRLDQDGIAYRVEVPGARIEDGVLELNAAFPGLTLQYRDSSGQFVTYHPEAPPSISATEVRAVTVSGRVGRSVPVP